MAKIEVKNGELIVHIEGLFDHLMTLRSSVHVPIGHVTAVRAHPGELLDESFIIRIFGASLMQTHVGYFYKKDDGIVMCDIHDLKEVIAVDLKEERLKHLYLQISDESADDAARRIQDCLASPNP